jgi:hypothetical protein
MATEFSEAIAPWITERAAAREAEWAARRTAKAQLRADRKAARDAGLIERHRRKLSGRRMRPSAT